jgi:hypothetical protein
MDTALFLADVHGGNIDFLLHSDFVFARKGQDEHCVNSHR